MRKPPTSDANRTRPASASSDAVVPAASTTPLAPEAAPEPVREAAGEPLPSPTLVWPPADDELRDWEVLHLHSTGQTVIEPMKFVPPSAKAPAAHSGERPVPAAPAPYAPPAPIDDPVGETSLLPPALTSDFDLPETELIEPLTEQAKTQPALAPPSGSGPAAAAPPAPEPMPDDRTMMIPRPPLAPPRHEPADETNTALGATRILVAPKFAASVQHAPTVPVSALHRAEVPLRIEPRRPMEETLPAGISREMLRAADPATRPGASDETAFIPAPQADTNPVGVPRLAPPATPAGAAPAPFSRLGARGAQPVTPSAAPEPAHPPALVPRPAPLPVAAPVAVGAPIPTRVAPPSTMKRLLMLGAAAAAVVAIGLGAYWYVSMRSAAAAPLAPATLSVDSSPSGAEVSIDGTPRGRTPLRLELVEGAHTLDVTHSGATKRIPLTLAAGTVTVHSLEFAAPPVAAVGDSAIEIRSDPAGARVLVDGVARGTTPIVVTGLAAGRHEVQVSGPFRAITKTITLAPKQQARLVVTPARSADSPDEPSRGASRASSETGYITIQSPIVLRVVRNGDFVGTSEDTRLSLPVGSHVIGLENESVGFRDVRTIDVAGGKVTTVPVTLPNGAISINARPWAEVWVDGKRIGETPVSQLALPVGVHEIVFRHPEHGERTVSVVVKIGATGRAFTDFTK